MANEDVLVSFRAEDQLTAVLRNLQAEFKQMNKGLEGLSDTFKTSFNQQATAVKNSQTQVKSELNNTKQSFINFRRIVETTLGVGLYDVLKQGIGAMKDFASQGIQMAAEQERSFVSLSIIAQRFNQDQNQVIAVAKELGKELRIGPGASAEALQNLLKSGLNLAQASDLMKRFTNEALTGKSANIDLATAVKNLSFAYTTGNSALGNMSGISENFSDIEKKGTEILKAKGVAVGDITAEMARYEGMIAVTNLTMGSSEKLQGTFTDNFAIFDQTIKQVQTNLGNTFMPMLNEMLESLTPIAESIQILTANLAALTTGQINFEQFLQLAGISDQIIQSMMWLGATIQWVGGMITQFFQSDLGQGIAIGAMVAGVIFGLVIPAIAGLATMIMSLGGLFGILLSPISIVIGAVALLFTAWQANFMGIQEVTQQVIQMFGRDITGLARFFGETLVSMVDIFDNGFKGILSGLASFLESFGTPTTEFLDWLFSIFADSFGAVYESVMGVYANMLEGVGIAYANWQNVTAEVLYLISDLFAGRFEAIAEKLRKWGELLISFFNDVWESISTGAGNAFVEMGNVIGQKFTDIVNSIIEMVNKVAKSINSILASDAIKKVFGLSGSFKLINEMDTVTFNAQSTEAAEPETSWNEQISNIFKDVGDSAKADGQKFKDSMAKAAGEIRNGGAAIKQSSEKFSLGAKSSLDSLIRGLNNEKNSPNQSAQAIKALLTSIGANINSFGTSMSQFETSKINIPDFQQMMAALQGQFGGLQQFTPQGQAQGMPQFSMEDLKQKVGAGLFGGSGSGKKTGSGGSKGGKSEAEKELDKQAELLRLKERQLQLEKENIKAQQEMALRPLQDQLDKQKDINKAELERLQLQYDQAKAKRDLQDVVSDETKALQEQVDALQKRVILEDQTLPKEELAKLQNQLEDAKYQLSISKGKDKQNNTALQAQADSQLATLKQQLDAKKADLASQSDALANQIETLKRQQQSQLDQLEAKQRQLNQQQFDLDVRRSGAVDQFGGTNISNGGTLNLNGDIAINNTADLGSFADLLKSALLG